MTSSVISFVVSLEGGVAGGVVASLSLEGRVGGGVLGGDGVWSGGDSDGMSVDASFRSVGLLADWIVDGAGRDGSAGVAGGVDAGGVAGGGGEGEGGGVGGGVGSCGCGGRDGSHGGAVFIRLNRCLVDGG